MEIIYGQFRLLICLRTFSCKFGQNLTWALKFKPVLHQAYGDNKLPSGSLQGHLCLQTLQYGLESDQGMTRLEITAYLGISGLQMSSEACGHFVLGQINLWMAIVCGDWLSAMSYPGLWLHLVLIKWILSICDVEKNTSNSLI